MTYMKLKQPRKQPPIGMTLAVTLCMPERQNLDQSRDSLLKFFASLDSIYRSTGAVWMKTSLGSVPAQFEEPLRKALDDAEAQIAARMPKLTVVK